MNLFKAIAIYLLTLVFSSQLVAKECPTQNIIFKNALIDQSYEGYFFDNFYWLDKPDESFDCSNIIEIENLLSEVSTFYQDYFKPFSDISLVLTPRYDNAMASHNEKLLYLYYQTEERGKTLHPVYSHSTWVHEYAHLVFDQKLIEEWSDYKLSYELETTLGRYISLSSLFYANENDIFPLEKFFKISELENEKEMVLKNYNELVSDPVILRYLILVSSITDSFHELFADVFSVAYFQEGDAISDGMMLTGVSGENDYKRNFLDRRNEIERMNRALPQYSGSNELADDYHTFYSPVRFHLWKYYLSSGIPRKQIPLLIATVFDSLKEEMKSLASLAIEEDFYFLSPFVSTDLHSIEKHDRLYTRTSSAFSYSLSQHYKKKRDTDYIYELNKRLINRLDKDLAAFR